MTCETPPLSYIWLRSRPVLISLYALLVSFVLFSSFSFLIFPHHKYSNNYFFTSWKIKSSSNCPKKTKESLLIKAVHQVAFVIKTNHSTSEAVFDNAVVYFYCNQLYLLNLYKRVVNICQKI